mmetsp:Transcript_4828/g.9209  ORF Transcript_4828/g.9209 Transcript_4828/m.9209 type:complete len:208 (+) Transcript_4828:61-684(+)
MHFFILVAFWALRYLVPVVAFSPHEGIKKSPLPMTSHSEVVEPLDSSRRKVLQILTASVAFQGLNFDVAHASGGATAGGAYLLSAKQRYNQRVKAGVQGFVDLQRNVVSGNLEGLTVYFTSEEVGSWKDVSVAGYLLANAFRRSSTTPPDSLPSVKKWKAFAAEVDNLQKSFKKKDVKGVKASYDKALGLLNDYLDAVELPSILEIN